jgi:hypothetical protein
MSVLNYDNGKYNFYECEKITYSSPEFTNILSKPGKTLLCTQTILLDKPEWDIPNILKFSAILSLTVQTSKIPIEYTATIERISNGISFGEIDIGEFIYYSQRTYISDTIEIKSKNIFSKNDIVIIKFYGSSQSDEQNKLITSPKLFQSIYYNF